MTKQKEIKVTGISKQGLEMAKAHWEKFAKCYFWTPSMRASERRAEEKRNSQEWVFDVDGVPVIVSVEISCSCRNYYANRDVYVGGERKVQGLTYLKKLLKYGVFE